MHDSPGPEFARRAAEWAGFSLDQSQLAQLAAYAEWLEVEAIPAGGLGPREARRIWPRHIGDSLLFAKGWDTPPDELLDAGSGVGLPGIPLSILWPDCHVTLLDRAGRRTRLLRRVVRVLALPRVRVAQGDIFAVADEWNAVVYRGAVKAPEAVGLSSKLLSERGSAVLGLSRRSEPPAQARDLVGIANALGLRAEVVAAPPEILESSAWLLIMSRNDE